MSETDQASIGPVIRRDGAEFMYASDAGSLASWLEVDLVEEALKSNEYQVWTVDGRPLAIRTDNGHVQLQINPGEVDEAFRQMMSPICGKSPEDPPSFEEIALKLTELNLPEFTLLGLWPDETGRDRATSMDWHRPWEPRHRWTPEKGLQKIPFWRRF